MRISIAAVLAASSLYSSSVLAADLGAPRDASAYSPAAIVVPADASPRQFYVRGDVGIARYGFGSFSQPELTENGGSFISSSIADAATIGAGFGWQLNTRFRVDLTGEYRAKAAVKGMDNLTGELTVPADSTIQANTLYQGNVSAVAGLMNGYWDVMKWRGFTPYVGAGIGFAHIRMTDFTFVGAATVQELGVPDPITHAIVGVGMLRAIRGSAPRARARPRSAQPRTARCRRTCRPQKSPRPAACC